MVITKVGVLSVAKIGAVLYAGIGLLIGTLLSLISMIGIGAMGDNAGFLAPLFGMAAIVVAPICYGILGFIVTLISAAIFNVAAGITGGVEIEVKQS